MSVKVLTEDMPLGFMAFSFQNIKEKIMYMYLLVNEESGERFFIAIVNYIYKQLV
jgi:hypothetical protein